MWDYNFWKNKKVLITGHTGFKGSWLSMWLHDLGAEVIGYSIGSLTTKDNFVLSNLKERIIHITGDIRDFNHLEKVFKEYKPDIVFHLAAQPIVRISYDNPRETYETNVIGTLNILECIRNTSTAKVGIMVTTDKCYENKEQIWGYRETDPMGGYDPYSSSKACAELLISSYRNSFMNPQKFLEHNKAIASVRAGNVIGGGDWAVDRIIPDCIRAIEANKPIVIRNPDAVRPWEHVLEPLSGYILLAEKLWENPIKYAQGWNFGPKSESFSTVWEVAQRIVNNYGSGQLNITSDEKAVHEAVLLYLDITKAQHELGWKPRLSFEMTIEMTVDWYKRYEKENVYNICMEQIRVFKDLNKDKTKINPKGM